MQAVDDIIDLIESKTFSKNVENSLLGPLKKITKILADSNPDNDEATCGKLTEFIDTVDEKESSGKLSPDDADELREAAQRIQNVLGC